MKQVIGETLITKDKAVDAQVAHDIVALNCPLATYRREQPIYKLIQKIDLFLHELMDHADFKDKAGDLHAEIHDESYNYVTGPVIDETSIEKRNFLSKWNRESIAKKRRAAAVTSLADNTKEDLIERIIALETVLYPFVYVFSSLGEDSWRGTTATSKLFPLLSDDNKFGVYKPANEEEGTSSDTVLMDTIPESQLHEIDYYQADSITVMKGSDLHDDFEILAVHQQAPGAYVGCGSISMGDVRQATKLIFPAHPVGQKTE